MCGSGQQSGAPSSMGEALDMISAGFAWLAAADVASVPVSVQAECLRELERVGSVETAARARVLGAFDAGLGYEYDGCRSARTWLMWQTRVTPAAATAGVGWMRRLRAHPAVNDARQVRLGTTVGGAGRLDGDLTPQCAAALAAVLDALGKKMGAGRCADRRAAAP